VKRTPADLSIFGAKPEFDETLHVGRPNLGNPEALLRRFNDILDRRWFTNNGTYVQEFQRRIAEYVGVKHCIAICNGTVGIEIISHRDQRQDGRDIGGNGGNKANWKGIRGLQLMAYGETERRNFQYVVREVDTDTAKLTREGLIRVLHAENVAARRYFYAGCHRM
jgi:hypothetical protein